MTTTDGVGIVCDVGKTYSGCDEALEDLRNYADEQHFQFAVWKRDKNRIVLKCHDNNCSWIVRFSRPNRDLPLRLTSKEGNHSCLGSVQRSRGSQSNLLWVLSKIKTEMEIDNNLKTKHIISHMLRNHGIKISYSLAHHAKETVLLETTTSQQALFALLPSYIQRLMNADPTTTAILESDDNQQFRRVFVCPGPAISAFRFSRRFMAVDGTFMRSRFVQVSEFSILFCCEMIRY